MYIPMMFSLPCNHVEIVRKIRLLTMKLARFLVTFYDACISY